MSFCVISASLHAQTLTDRVLQADEKDRARVIARLLVESSSLFQDKILQAELTAKNYIVVGPMSVEPASKPFVPRDVISKGIFVSSKRYAYWKNVMDSDGNFTISTSQDDNYHTYFYTADSKLMQVSRHEYAPTLNDKFSWFVQVCGLGKMKLQKFDYTVETYAKEIEGYLWKSTKPNADGGVEILLEKKFPLPSGSVTTIVGFRELGSQLVPVSESSINKSDFFHDESFSTPVFDRQDSETQMEYRILNGMYIPYRFNRVRINSKENEKGEKVTKPFVFSRFHFEVDSAVFLDAFPMGLLIQPDAPKEIVFDFRKTDRDIRNPKAKQTSQLTIGIIFVALVSAVIVVAVLNFYRPRNR